VGCEARKIPADAGVFFLDFYLYRTYRDLSKIHGCTLVASCTSLHGFLTGVESLVELAVKKMFMKESIILSLADADDFTIDFEHVLALANSLDFNFWFYRPPLSSQMPKNI
jgi:hypothetical protein